MAATSRMPKLNTKTETDVAVLQVQVTNIEAKIVELKDDIREVHDSADRYADRTVELLREMSDRADQAHRELNKKINALEKWRWMLMGAGIALGSMGYNLVGQLLK